MISTALIFLWWNVWNTWFSVVQYWIYYSSSENMIKSAGQKKNTYSDSDVWLNASWPFSPVLLLDFSHSPILGGKVPSILKTCGCSLWSSNTFLFHLTTFHLEFSSRRFFSLSMWPAANFSRALMCHIWSNSIILAGCWCKIHLTEDTDSRLPAASNSFHFGCF